MSRYQFYLLQTYLMVIIGKLGLILGEPSQSINIATTLAGIFLVLSVISLVLEKR